MVEIQFRTKKMEKAANKYAALQKEYGEHAKKIAMRLQQLGAAENLSIYEQLDPLARLHQLTGDRFEEFAVDISGNFRLLFKVLNDPVPRKDDGSEAIDRRRVTKIMILELRKDYHG